MSMNVSFKIRYLLLVGKVSLGVSGLQHGDKSGKEILEQITFRSIPLFFDVETPYPNYRPAGK